MFLENAISLGMVIMCSAHTSVELDVFSGQPNPIWSLNASQCEKVEKHLGQLSKATGESLPSPPILGYRGVIVHYKNNQGIKESIRFYRGVAQSEQLQLRDIDRKLEKWVLNTGQDVIDSNMWRYLPTELTQ